MEINAFCPHPFNRIHITGSGNVAMCDSQNPCIGNLENNIFDEIWFSETAEAIRQEVLAGRLHKQCNCLIKTHSEEKVIYNEYPNFLEIDLPVTQAVIEKIKHIVPNLIRIDIKGEPFDKTLFDVLDWLEFDQYKYKCSVGIVTNAILMGEQIRREYLNRCPNSITKVSVDSDTIVENFYAFNRERIRNRQFLWLINSVNIMNVHKVVDMVRIGNKAKVEFVEFVSDNVDETNCGLFKRAQQKIVEECRRLNVACVFARPLDLGLSDMLVCKTL